MAATTTKGSLQLHLTSPKSTVKGLQQPPENDHESSAEDGSSADEAHARSQSGAPGKRRRPLTITCETCKQRKVKCDRGAPACGWCVKNSAVCVYLPRKKPGLRAGYGRELEARLDKLEHALAQQQSQIAQLSKAPISTASPHDAASSLRSPPVIHALHIPRPETALFIQKPTAAFPSQNAIQNQFGVPDNRPAPPTNDIGYEQPEEHMLGGIRHDSYITSSNNSRFHPAVSKYLDQSTVDFPPYDLLYALVDLFFKHIYPWCPILHRQTTLNAFFGDTSLDEPDRIILHAIVATTIRFSTDQRLTLENRARYRQTSKEKVLLYGIENSSVKSLQAFVILALDVVGCSNGPPGWNLLALITRSVVQLGLSVEKFSPSVAPKYASIYTLRAIILPEPKDWIEEETRRRLFWIIYILDRYATVATAFDFALDDDEVDRKLPCHDDFFARNLPVDTQWFRTSTRSGYGVDRPDNLSSLSCYIEILGLLTRIHKFLKKPVDITSLSDVGMWQSEYRELDKAIEQWRYNLPREFVDLVKVFAKPSSTNQSLISNIIMLHTAYHTTIIRLHSSAAYPAHRSPIFAPSYSASQRCLSAVESIVSLCVCVQEHDLLSKLGPPFAFSLWVAARVLLVHGSTIDHHVDPSIDVLVRTLQEFGQFWEVGARYANLLSRVLSEYQESQQTPAGANGERSTPSSMKILADMRRCAFDLDFLISRQPKLNTRLPSVAPARTPAPNELEYLDVFDFFNMPRLPAPIDSTISYSSPDGVVLVPAGEHENESNITNYTVDASSDWFMKQSV